MLYSPKSLISYAFALNSDFVYEEGEEVSKLTKLQVYCEHLSSETQDKGAIQVTEAINCLKQCVRDLCGLNKTSELKKINSALDPIKFFSSAEYQVDSSSRAPDSLFKIKSVEEMASQRTVQSLSGALELARSFSVPIEPGNLIFIYLKKFLTNYSNFYMFYFPLHEII